MLGKIFEAKTTSLENDDPFLLEGQGALPAPSLPTTDPSNPFSLDYKGKKQVVRVDKKEFGSARDALNYLKENESRVSPAERLKVVLLAKFTNLGLLSRLEKATNDVLRNQMDLEYPTLGETLVEVKNEKARSALRNKHFVSM